MYSEGSYLRSRGKRKFKTVLLKRLNSIATEIINKSHKSAHLMPDGQAPGSGRVWRDQGKGCVLGSQEDSHWRKLSGGDLRRSCDCCASLCSPLTASSRCFVAWRRNKSRNVAS